MINDPIRGLGIKVGINDNMIEILYIEKKIIP